MAISEKKLQRLTLAARLYYEEEKNQDEIAAILGVSRPMVSRLLTEAREAGIIHIEVRSPVPQNGAALARLRAAFELDGGVVVPGERGNPATNSTIAQAAITFLADRPAHRLGLGWGSMLGAVVSELEQHEPRSCIADEVLPLVGNNEVTSRNYHSNELVRAFAHHAMALPHYLHGPAYFTSGDALREHCSQESYRAIEQLWYTMDAAVVNIGNYPYASDVGAIVSFDHVLKEQGAVGRLLNYYYTQDGTILPSEANHALQIPLEALAACGCVTAVCCTAVSPKALLGALRTGLLHNLIAPEDVVEQALALL